MRGQQGRGSLIVLVLGYISCEKSMCKYQIFKYNCSFLMNFVPLLQTVHTEHLLRSVNLIFKKNFAHTLSVGLSRILIFRNDLICTEIKSSEY